MSRDENSFFARWSRRKRTTDASPAADALDESDAPTTSPDSPANDETDDRSDAEILDALGLQDPDTLGPGGDFRAFMESAVPEHIRRRALRGLWRSNPVLANLDGLNDYDGDFTGGSVGPGMLKTSYQVGRGFVRDLAQASESGGPDRDKECPDEPESQMDSAEPVEISTKEESSENIAAKNEETGPGPRRRMRFRYES